jgi:hypothetical protein
MVMTASNGDLVIQGQPPTTRSAQPTAQAATTAQEAATTAQEAARTAQEAQRLAERSVRDQITEQVRTQITGAAAQPGATPAPPAPDLPHRFTIRGPNGEETIIGMPPAGEIIPPQVVDISLAFFFTIAFIIVGLPIARAFARRMDRKSGTVQIPNEVSTQLAHLNQAVDAIALEVERITEGQRFTTKLLSEQRDAARQTLPSAANR